MWRFDFLGWSFSKSMRVLAKARSSRPVMIRLHPLSANARAMARPMPRLAPVMRARRPTRLCSRVSLRLGIIFSLCQPLLCFEEGVYNSAIAGIWEGHGSKIASRACTGLPWTGEDARRSIGQSHTVRALADQRQEFG